MLWHRQMIFKSKGDKLCSSAECRIWTRGPRHQIASRLNARWQTDWAIEDQAKNLNSTARPYDQRAFCPLGPTVSWLLHLALAIYIFVVVNFDALAQARDIQIERRQVVFLCWMQDLNPGPQTPNRQQTECSLTNRLSYRGSSKKLELDSPSLWSASIQPTWPHCQLTFKHCRTWSLLKAQQSLLLNSIISTTLWNYIYLEQDGFEVITWCVGWCVKKTNHPKFAFMHANQYCQKFIW